MLHKDQTMQEQVGRTPDWRRITFLSLIGWTVFGLFTTAASYLQWCLAMGTFDVMVPWRRIMAPSWVWGLFTPLIFAVDQRLLGTLTPARRILAHIPLALVVTPAVMAADYGVQRLLNSYPTQNTTLLFYMLGSVQSALTFYALIVGMSMASSFGEVARRREQEAAKLALHSSQLETHLAQARLQALQSQVNPHFLFNALNTISAFTETRPALARQMMAHLGTLLRASLDHAERQEVTLEEELAFLDNYLAIERLRFEDRLTVDFDVPSDVRNAMVPSFALQPLVENAIRHGTGALLHGGHVRLSASRQGGFLKIHVEDDGVGLPHGWCLEDHAGVGLSNTARRLQELYGSEQKFSVSNRPEGGVCVELSFPFRRSSSRRTASPAAASVS